MVASSPPSGASPGPGDIDDPEALPKNCRLMRSLVLASLAPFFLLSLGHYFSVTLVIVHHAVQISHLRYQRGEYFWVFDDAKEDSNVFVFTELAVAAVSFAMVCLSLAAAISASAAVNSGRRLTLGELLSRVGRLWREPSITRVYSTVLLLGYVLSVILVLVVVVLSSGGEVSARELQLLLCLLALLLCVYVGVVGSVGTGSFLVEEGEEGVGGLWKAVELMEEGKLQGFLVFFLSLVVTHGFLVTGGLWRDDLRTVQVAAVRVSPGPVLMNAVWMVGAGGLFGYAGVLLVI